MGTPHSPKLQSHWNVTIRLFSVIPRALVGGALPLCRGAVGYSTATADRATRLCCNSFNIDIFNKKEGEYEQALKNRSNITSLLHNAY